ncbi:MAG: 16S rRNA (uracil(1498)-N(3))-methyltransferase [Candidatus Omnitrophica bacterium]|nr:16S rRNA (uracil(1498)-N(3))-methyltransferase [Candidatus Omnitrophota bacterium]
MHRFFIDRKQEHEISLWLSPEESRHAVKVLRIKKGGLIRAFDHTGCEYEAKVCDIDLDGRVQIEIVTTLKKDIPIGFRIHVAQGFLQKQKMDWIVEKACEIGISTLIPLKSEFSMVNPKGDAIERIQNRWSRIAQAAAKQSGNLTIPQILEPLAFSGALQQAKKSNVRFLFHPYSAKLNLHQAVEKAASKTKPVDVFLLVGPEGGFSEKEVKLADEAGIETVGLGQNILRAETAFVVLAGGFKLLL